MKKYLPLILLGIGILVFVGVYFLVIKGKSDESIDIEDESTLIEVTLDKRPIVSLTPSSDGHWLYMKIKNLKVDAKTLDYEFLYKVPDGRTQGVPGTIELEGEKEIERDLLLGSESSGKFRYDEGVEKGTLTLRYRNEKGRLIAKFSTEISLLSGVDEIETPDGELTYTFDKSPKGFLVSMDVFGVSELPDGELVSGPYGIFSSEEGKLSGEIDNKSGEAYSWSGSSWDKLSNGEASDIGYFIITSE